MQKNTPRVSLILLTVEKVERKNLDVVVVVVFLLFFLSFFLSFFFPHAYLNDNVMYTSDLHTKRVLYY